jgi:ferrochelatase
MQFLADPRVLEVPGWVRRLILAGVYFRRCRQSAVRYRRIWDPRTGMPLLRHTRNQAAGLQKLMRPGYIVRFAMRYGNPSIAETIEELIAAGIERITVLPMYPQYSATTTASALDGLFDALRGQRRLPAIAVVPPYYEHPAYLDAMTALIAEDLAKLPWQPEHYLLSFHGIPQAYTQRGDPYALHVERTTQALVKRLGWPKGRWSRTYQSLFGKAAWLKPYTEEKLKALARAGVRKVFIAQPGFTADCLETIDEIGFEARETFRQAGGEELHRCPCLNDHPRWLEALRELAMGPIKTA